MKTIINSLYWRISATFLLLLLIVGGVYIYITVQTAEQYFLEKHQRLNAHIAESMVKEVKPFLNGEVNKNMIDGLMHSMMAANPSIEVYVLSEAGEILAFVDTEMDPEKKRPVKLEKVELEPVREFLETEGQKGVLGEDPRNPGVFKVFSAASVEEAGNLVGYVYIILASVEYDFVSQYLFDDFLLTLGGRNIIFTLVAALLIGLLVIWVVTRYLRQIIETVRRFSKGDYRARIPVRSQGELSQLSNTFNEMADTIVEDMEKRDAVENLRKELIANVSHDLRTPLAVVRGYIETLSIKGKALGEQEREKYIQTTLDGIDKLEKLVNDLFELSKLEADQVQLQKEPFSLSELVQDVVYKYQLLAQEKGINLKLNLSQDHSIVIADIALIERVLQNLIDNALKFTPEGGDIEVEISKLDEEVKVSVLDTGPGIPEEEIPHIFDRYHQAKTNAAKTGSGLGLAIVKKILELHDTAISLTSKLNQGCQFSFSLPLYAKG